jgi:PBSX family phage terminase large subunit
LYIGENRFHVVGGGTESSFCTIQGMTCAGVLFDEATLLKESFYEMAVSRCSAENSKFWINCNPDLPTHWLKRKLIDRPNPKLTRLTFTLEDNPGLVPAVVDRLKSIFTGRRYARLILGEWTGTDQAVYPMFDKKIHLTGDLPPENARWFASIDYGYNAPTSIGLWALHDDVYTRAAEFYWISGENDGNGLTHDAVVAKLKALAGRHHLEYVVYDPSAPALGAALAAAGYTARPGTNRVLTGISHVQRLLEQEKIKIHDSCTHFFREIYSYQFRAETDHILKQNDHAMDEMRYFVMSRQQIPLEDYIVRPGSPQKKSALSDDSVDISVSEIAEKSADAPQQDSSLSDEISAVSVDIPPKSIVFPNPAPQQDSSLSDKISAVSVDISPKSIAFPNPAPQQDSSLSDKNPRVSVDIFDPAVPEKSILSQRNMPKNSAQKEKIPPDLITTTEFPPQLHNPTLRAALRRPNPPQSPPRRPFRHVA